VAPTSKMNLAGSPVVLSRGPSGGLSHGDRNADQSFLGRRYSFGKEESKGGQSDGIPILDSSPMLQMLGRSAFHNSI
jgi:hypothetical protein